MDIKMVFFIVSILFFDSAHRRQGSACEPGIIHSVTEDTKHFVQKLARMPGIRRNGVRGSERSGSHDRINIFPHGFPAGGHFKKRSVNSIANKGISVWQTLSTGYF